MLIDCERCSVRGAACGGCVVTLMLETSSTVHRLGPAEVRAIEVLSLAGFEVEVLEPTHEVRSRSTGRRARNWHAA